MQSGKPRTLSALLLCRFSHPNEPKERHVVAVLEIPRIIHNVQDLDEMHLLVTTEVYPFLKEKVGEWKVSAQFSIEGRFAPPI